MEIILMRHGEPAYELKGRVQANEISGVIEGYDLSGIKDKPPKITIDRVSSVSAVVCSDLKRSIESAKALGFSKIHQSRALYREVATPHFKGGEFSMSLYKWGVFLRVISIFGFSRNGESLSMARIRAIEAASELVNLAKEKKSVLLVGHGFINYFIAKELLRKKWLGPSKPGGGYWEYGTYKFVK
jgi:broad specificity phosphatase PhoE